VKLWLSHIWKVNSEGLLPDVRKVADGSAFVLVVVVLFLNGLARYMSHRVGRKMMGMD
jgi:phosphate transport system permease protein